NNMKLSIAWFVAFAPQDNPEVAIVVLVEGTVPQDDVQGGLNAAPIAQNVLRKYFEQQQSQ
ncbi:MAG: penicillin-binding transpeptidase domain-containing protein, partial [Opitutales bacterium]